MKKIMIDMDNVICEGGYLNVVNKFLKTNYKIEDVKDYYVQNLIPMTRMQEWEEFWANENFYDYANLTKDVYQVIEKLNKKYELYIASSHIFGNNAELIGNLIKNKVIYLNNNLPFIKPEQYIFIHNKELLNCEIIIDDSLSNLLGKAELKILFPAHHNKDLKKEDLKDKGIIKVSGWKEIESILL